MINLFLTDLSQAIQDAGGTIDKYIGDCIMAFWNAPSEIETHAQAACMAALRMKEQLIALNQQLDDDEALKNLLVWAISHRRWREYGAMFGR